MPPPLRVAVTVELLREAGAGGQVKCWERFAEAACALPKELDLTVFFLSRTPTVERLAGNVRVETLRPVFPTDRVPFLPQVAPVTDIAPYHPGLARRLRGFDLVHATHAFAFADTARSAARHLPFVASIQSDLPYFARAYMSDILRRRFGKRAGEGFFGDRLDVVGRCVRAMRRRVARLIGATDWLFVSHENDIAPYPEAVHGKPVSRLRRGIDRARFDPARRDRAWLAETFGVPDDKPVVLFAGRVDDSKNVMILARAARRLVDQGVALHLFAAGKGARIPDVQGLLGEHATLPGMLDQDVLARVYASADIFAFPSESEVMPNAVLEARTSGLPVVLSARDNGAANVRRPGIDGVLVGETTPDAWARALWPLLAYPAGRTAMGSAARRAMAADWPDWTTVLAEDLLEVWRYVAAARAGQVPPRRLGDLPLNAFRPAAGRSELAS